jgi:N-acyl-D-glutamate deacylase
VAPSSEPDEKNWKMNCSTRVLAGTLIVSALACSPGLAQDYDLVIANGRVMDPETLFDGIANVGVTDGRIVAISTDPLTGVETVDANGHVVAPGFIDTHFHWQAPLGYALGLRDGLTSAMDLELARPGTHIARWYEARAGVTQANYGCASSHEQARQMVIDGKMSDEIYMTGPMAVMEARKKSGWSLDRATRELGNEILEIIDTGLQDGAIGIGSTLGYMRDGVTTGCLVLMPVNRSGSNPRTSRASSRSRKRHGMRSSRR